jgi:hypothetical protein
MEENVRPQNNENVENQYKNVNEQPKKKSWFKRNVGATIIMSLMLIVIIYLGINLMLKQKHHREELENQRAQYTSQIDSLKKENYTWLTKVFSWSIRSEWMRNNLEQVLWYSEDLLKFGDINNIKLVDPSGRVIFSTNMKDQNVITEWSNIQKIEIQEKSDKLVVASPIMGTDMPMGAVVIEYKINKQINDTEN